jgi:hypothetical protein
MEVLGCFCCVVSFSEGVYRLHDRFWDLGKWII